MDVLVNVSNQKLKVATNLKNFVAGTQEFVKFVFNMSSDWDNLTVFAQFMQNGTAYNQYLDDDNAAYLPSEICAGKCTMMLYGSKDTTIATTNYLTLTIDESALVQDAESTEISQSLYDQLVSKVEEAVSKSSEAVSYVDNLSNNEYVAAKIESAVSEEMAEYLSNGSLANMTIEDGSITIDKLSADAVDTSMSGESENPVQNKIIKSYVDNFEKWRTIQAVTSTEEVEMFKFTTDSDGNAFALKKLVIFGRLYFDYPDEMTTDTMLLRVKSDGGSRYFAMPSFIKSKVTDGSIAFTAKALYDANTGITYNEYLMSGSSKMQGIGTNQQYSGSEMTYPITHAIKDVNVYIHYRNSGDTDYSYLPLKAGSQITILGVDE